MEILYVKNSKKNQFQAIKCILASLLVAISFPGPLSAENLVLSKIALGSLKLSQELLISVKDIKNTFPRYSVKYEIRSGDSPDFHFISVHVDNAIGDDMIYYQVKVKPSVEFEKIGLDYANPENVTKAQIIEDNPKVISISWPYPSWD